MVHTEGRRSATAERILSGRLPLPRWVTVHPGSGATGRCDGCGDVIAAGDYAFSVLLKDEIRFQFHNECFDVYNRTSFGPK